MIGSDGNNAIGKSRDGGSGGGRSWNRSRGRGGGGGDDDIGGRGSRGRGGRGGRGTGRNNNNNHKRGFTPTSLSESYSSPGKRSHPNNNDNEVVGNTIKISGCGHQQTRSEKIATRTAAPSRSKPTSASTAQKEQKLAHITDQLFADLDISAASRRALSEVFQYQYMTSVQAETLPLILQKQDQDCLAKAKTGTGKTLAFMIPTIEKIVNQINDNNNNNNTSNSKNPSSSIPIIPCLVISPTRELAQQIANETSKLLTFHPPQFRKVVTCVGGTNKNADLRAFQLDASSSSSSSTPVVVVVATPGRLLDHLKTTPGFAERMSHVSTLILDECDQLLDMGFRPDIERILSILTPVNKRQLQLRQTLLFSATIPPSVDEIASLALRPNYNFVDTVGEDTEQTHVHVQQQLMITTQESIVPSLFAILEREIATAAGSDRKYYRGGDNTNDEIMNDGYKIIVFFTTARLTGFMAELFNSVSRETGYTVLEIHSRRSQSARERASEQFRKSKNSILFSSDVSARGMDYPDVTFVLQIGLTDRAQYIHRLGRTARAGKMGSGGLLLANYEEHHMTKRELTDMPLERIPVPNSERANDIASCAIGNVSKHPTLRNSAEQAYRAWLGYYNGHLKKVQWDKKRLVLQANAFGTEVGLVVQPSLQKKTVGKMGLRNVPGLIIED